MIFCSSITIKHEGKKLKFKINAYVHSIFYGLDKE